jgi:hypothetical protein
VQSVGSEPTIRRNITVCLPSAFTLVSCSANSSNLKMEAMCYFETSIDFQRTARRYSTVHNHCCKNLKSYITSLCLHKKYYVILMCLRFMLQIFQHSDYAPQSWPTACVHTSSRCLQYITSYIMKCCRGFSRMMILCLLWSARPF